MDNSAYEMGKAFGIVIGGLLCFLGPLLAIAAIVFACIKRTKGWIITAVVICLLGVAGVGILFVNGVKQAWAEVKSGGSFKTVESKDGWVSLSVPSSWRQLDELHADAIVKVGNKFAEEYLVVLSDLRSDYAGTFEEFAKFTTTRMRDNLTDGTMTPPQPLTINGHRAQRTTIEGTAEKTRVCYLHTSIETPDGFHQILQWTLPSKKDKAFPKFEKVDVSFKVVKPRAPVEASKPKVKRTGSVEERVKAIVADQFEMKAGEVKMEARLTTDLGADELDAVELVMAIEDEFDVEVSDEDAEKFSRVSDIVDWVTRRKGRTETF